MEGPRNLDGPEDPKSAQSKARMAPSIRRIATVTARFVWWAIALSVLALFVRGIPELHGLVFSNSVPAAYESLSRAVVAGLTHGWYSPQSLAIIVIATGLLTLLIYFSVGAIILHRTGGAGFPLFSAYLLLTLGIALNADLLLATQTMDAAGAAIEVLANVGFASLLVFVFLFPNGKAVPRWMAIPLAVYLVFALPEPLGVSWMPDTPAVVLAAVPLLGLASQGYRYLRVSSSEERQQTKWVVLALGIILTIGIIGLLAGPDAGDLTYVPATVSFWFLPIAVGLAISRYRLWDVDSIISRALVYGILTTVLAGIFSASVAFVGQASEQLLGSDSKAAAAAVSAVLVAVLFQPLRERIERSINRRFFVAQEKLATGLIEAQQGFWPFIDLSDLLEAALPQIASAMEVQIAAIYVKSDDGSLFPRSSLGIPNHDLEALAISADQMNAFSKKRAVPANLAPFTALVPMLVPRLSEPDVIGVLALGQRAKGRGYSGYDLKSLVEVGESLGTAIYALSTKESK